jgi:hypothetical protein
MINIEQKNKDKTGSSRGKAAYKKYEFYGETSGHKS